MRTLSYSAPKLKKIHNNYNHRYFKSRLACSFLAVIFAVAFVLAIDYVTARGQAMMGRESISSLPTLDQMLVRIKSLRLLSIIRRFLIIGASYLSALFDIFLSAVKEIMNL